MTAHNWKTSSYTHNENCVEVHHQLDELRDSKDPNGPVLVVGRSAFTSFVDAVKAGRFDS